jgi:hypothetical protein
MTAASDAVTGKLKLLSVMFHGTGLTAGEAVKIAEASGATIFDGYVEATHQNMELCPVEGMWVDGITWTTKPATGTSKLTIRVE